MITWNYNPPDNANEKIIQDDWNQTLVTEFNKIYALSTENSNDTLCKKYNSLMKIVVPIKFKLLIESLSTYKDEKIGDRYIVDFFKHEIDFL